MFRWGLVCLFPKKTAHTSWEPPPCRSLTSHWEPGLCSRWIVLSCPLGTFQINISANKFFLSHFHTKCHSLDRRAVTGSGRSASRVFKRLVVFKEWVVGFFSIHLPTGGSLGRLSTSLTWDRVQTGSLKRQFYLHPSRPCSGWGEWLLAMPCISFDFFFKSPLIVCLSDKWVWMSQHRVDLGVCDRTGIEVIGRRAGIPLFYIISSLVFSA